MLSWCVLLLDVLLETDSRNSFKVLSYVIGFSKFQTIGMLKINSQDTENSAQQQQQSAASNCNINPFHMACWKVQCRGLCFCGCFGFCVCTWKHVCELLNFKLPRNRTALLYHSLNFYCCTGKKIIKKKHKGYIHYIWSFIWISPKYRPLLPFFTWFCCCNSWLDGLFCLHVSFLLISDKINLCIHILFFLTEA